MRWPTAPPGTIVDIALLLEGTYPFVRGGVSSWLHELITGLPERTFSIAFLGGAPGSAAEPAFELPPNVLHLQVHDLLRAPDVPQKRALPINPEALEATHRMHEAFAASAPLPTDAMHQLAIGLGRPNGVTKDAFLHGTEAWDRICALYEERSEEPSFVDYFWSVRAMHLPLFELAHVAESLPPARAFHAISTGYAGFLGMLLRHRRQRPLMITEHGIYTKERRIDLAHATWLKDGHGPDGGYLRGLWARSFEGLGRCAYKAADVVTTLYEGNRARQVADGANPDTTQVIPNGIDVARFSPLRARRPRPIPKVAGLIGRVVPIKDVRTFVRAMSIVCARVPDAEGWIIGPESEDADYAAECHELVSELGLEGRVKFLGFRKPDQVLPELGVLVLTSISEALPLVLLEGWASGLPSVATDVGACRELVEGSSPEDRALGAAGIVTPIAAPEETANAVVSLLTDPARWEAASAAGIARVERHYTRDAMLDSYRGLYEEALTWRA